MAIPRPIFRIDRDEKSLPGFRRRGRRTARSEFVLASVDRRPGEQRRKSGRRAADQVVFGREQSDGDLVLGCPPNAAKPIIADLENIAEADDVVSILRRQVRGFLA